MDKNEERTKTLSKDLSAPLISVIMPVYKAERTLSRAIDSLLRQDFSLPFEVLFAFDGGDESLTILEKYMAKYPHFRLFQHPYRFGPSKGRIEAIKEARGEYVCFIDSDDYYADNALSSFYATAIKEGADIVNSSFFIVKKKGISACPFKKSGLLLGKEAILKALYRDVSFRSFMWNKFFKRSLFLNSPLLSFEKPGDLFEDTALLGSLCLNAKRVVSIKDPLYFYDKTNPASLTSMTRTNRHEKHLDVFLALRLFYEKYGEEEALRAFYRTKWRSKTSLYYDLSLDRRRGAASPYINKEKERRKKVFAPDTTFSPSFLTERIIEIKEKD